MSDLIQNNLVALLGEEQLSQIFRSWPERMNLAVCLRQNGECRMQVFRQEEGLRVLPRLLRGMRLTSSEVAVYPKVEGHLSHSMSFSEEKQLLHIVQNAPEIVEEASDYSVNYTYAIEEGLDPVLFIHASRARYSQKQHLKPEEQRPSHTENYHPERPQASRIAQKRSHFQAGSAPHPDLPKFLQKPPVSKEKSAVAKAKPTQEASLRPRFCVIRDLRNGWISIELPGCVGQEVVVTKPEQIFVRGDRRALSFGKQLVDDASQALPKRIHVNFGEEKTLLGDALRKNLGIVRADVQDGLLVLELSNVLEVEAIVPPLVEEHSRNWHWKTWASAGTFAAFSALLLLSFYSLNGPDAETSIDWGQFRGDAGDESVTKFQRQLGMLDLTLKQADG